MDKKEKTQLISDIVQNIARFMKVQCSVEVHEESGESGSVLVSVYTPENARFMIGENGQSLRALEQIVRLVAYKKLGEDRRTLLLDVNDYRKTKTAQAVDTARQVLARVRINQKAEALSPMSSYERRVVHMELANHPDIETESIGDEPNRRIVIKPLAGISLK